MMWSEHKQRGSRIEWADIVPLDIAKLQVAWEKARTAARLRAVTGMTFREIGEAYGVTPARVRQMIEKYELRSLSPVEIYQSRAEAKRIPRAMLVPFLSRARDWLMVSG